jgi:ABC-type glycerol-3-phosphate transport system substrate-binding protein
VEWIRHPGPALAAAALLLAGGCGGPARDEYAPDGRLIVDYWEKWTGFEAEAMQAVVDDYNASQRRVFVRKLTVSQIDRKLMLACAGGNPPDLAGIWSANIPNFSEKNALLPLDRLLAAAGIGRTNYIPVFWDNCVHRGFIWALPTTPATVALHWNKALFREAGLDPDRPPRSLDELDAMAERLTVVEVVRTGRTVRVRFPELTPAERAANGFRLVQVGHLPQEPGWWLTLWPYWFGGQLWDGERRLTATNAANVACFAWFRRYAEKYGVDNVRAFGASFGNFSSPQNPFLAGKVAMELQGVWMYNFIHMYAPDLEWDAAPFPSADPARLPDVTVAESDVLVIPRGARHVAEAFDFLRYVSTPGPMEKLNRGQLKFSPLAVLSPSFVTNHPNPRIRLFMDLARSPNARTVPRTAIWTAYGEELGVAADRVRSLQAAPAGALADAQARTQPKFDRLWQRWDLVKDERLGEWSSTAARRPSGLPP